MKKMLTCMLAAVVLVFTGCEYDENAAINTTKTAGTLALTAWFAIDDPGATVKSNLTEVVNIISTVTVTNSTYIDTVYPVVVKYVDKTDKLTQPQKTLIESGSLIILSGIDQLFIRYPEMSKNRDIERKFVNAFCEGCIVALKLNNDDTNIVMSKKAYDFRVKCIQRRSLRK